MQIHLEEKEPMNEFRLAEFVYNLCENVGISVEATAKMILVKIDTEQKEIEGEYGMNILSLFDGMACGMLAMLEAGVKVDRYVAYEIDKYAVQTSQHNFPMIEHRGDVFQADFTEFEGFDWLVGGSPCTYWSIAQKNNRETEASGMGWELFSQYVRALREAKPAYFIYENNKSMSKAIRQSINETFGFDAICINSALVSAQNRQRLYWVGKRNADGTYSKCDIEQPEDRGILLRDVLEGATDREKGRSVICSAGRTTHREYYQKHQGNMAFEPVGIGYRGRMDNGKWVKQYESNGTEKANALTTAQTDSMVAEPVRIPEYGNDDKARCVTASYAYKGSGEGSLVSEAFPDNPNKQVRDYVAEPIYIGAVPDNKGTYMNGKQPSQQYRVYDPDGKGVALTTCAITNVPEKVYTDCQTIIKAIPEIAEKYGYVPEMFNAYNRAEITDKAPTLSTGSMATSSCAVNRFEGICGYATPVEWDEDGKPIKAVSAADGKTYTVYEVKDGQITIKGKSYPIKLADGFYIIRKLTVRECMRLQTVPEWYEFPVSDSQAYKMLGNGWTVSVISHLILSSLQNNH